MLPHKWLITFAAVCLASLAAGAGAAVAPVPAQIARDWVRWNKSTCRFDIVPRAQHPKKWVPQMRKAAPNTLIGFGEQTESNPFSQAVNTSVVRSIRQSGADAFVVNFNFPDPAAPLNQSRIMVDKKPDVMISFNGLAATLPAVNSLFQRACIPVIQITFEAPGTVLFGASNEVAGRMAGAYLARYVQRKGWRPQDVTLVGPTVQGFGAVNKRVTECGKSFVKALPKAHYQEVPSGTSAVTAQQALTDWLTAHPARGASKYIVSCTIADLWSISMANALASAGRSESAAIVGQGASLDGVKAIRAGGPIVGSVWFGAGQYGDYLVPMALDILAGKALPLKVHQKLLMVDSRNANKFYKGQ